MDLGRVATCPSLVGTSDSEAWWFRRVLLLYALVNLNYYTRPLARTWTADLLLASSATTLQRHDLITKKILKLLQDASLFKAIPLSTAIVPGFEVWRFISKLKKSPKDALQPSTVYNHVIFSCDDPCGAQFLTCFFGYRFLCKFRKIYKSYY